MQSISNGTNVKNEPIRYGNFTVYVVCSEERNEAIGFGSPPSAVTRSTSGITYRATVHITTLFVRTVCCSINEWKGGEKKRLADHPNNALTRPDTALHSSTFSESYWPAIVIIIKILFKGILHQNYMPIVLIPRPGGKRAHTTWNGWKSLGCCYARVYALCMCLNTVISY